MTNLVEVLASDKTPRDTAVGIPKKDTEQHKMYVDPPGTSLRYDDESHSRKLE